MKKERNSSIELLRLICMTMIVMLHCYGFAFNTANETNRHTIIAINSLFNIGASCFILISGFYGITFSIDKLLKLLYATAFYSVSLTIFKYFALGGDISTVSILRSFIPVVTFKYWFISSYVILMVLTPLINRMRGLWLSCPTALLLIGFSLIPTLFLTNPFGDSGKGPVNMIIVYMLGRTLASLEIDRKIGLMALSAIFFTAIMAAFALNEYYFFKYGSRNHPFSDDHSILTIIAACCCFLLFRKVHFTSRAINYIAASAFAIYIIHIELLHNFAVGFALREHADDSSLSLKILQCTGSILLFCLIIDKARTYYLGKAEDTVINRLCSFKIRQ